MASKMRPANLDFPSFHGKPDEYLDWKFYMTRVLRAIKAWNVVTGDETRPTGAGEDALKKQSEWDERDADAQLAICGKIAREGLIYVRDESLDTAKKMWDALETQFAGKTVQNKVNISERLYSMRMADGAEPMEFIAEMTKLIQQYRSCGEKFDDATAARRLIGSLPDSYSEVRAALLVRVKDLTWSDAVEAVREYYLMSNRSKNGDSSAIGAYQKRKPGKFGQNSGKPGYPKKGGGRGKGPQCYGCGKFGHIRRECPDENGARGSGSGRGKKTYAGYAAGYALTADRKGDGLGKATWIVDSGASDHMTNDRKQLTNYCEYEGPGKVYLGDDRTVASHGEGNLKLDVACDGDEGTLALTKVLYVPELGKNLLSVPSLSRKGAQMNFTDKRTVITQNGHSSPIAKLAGNMFVVSTECTEKTEAATAGSKSSAADLWHCRLGHLNAAYIQKLVKMGSMDGSGLKGTITLTEDCYGCAAGKLHRTPFTASETRCDQPLGLVHSDLCGPMPVGSIGGSWYVITFADDYSRYADVCFLRNKGQALKAFEDWVTHAENRTGCRVKALRSDNGGEYSSKAFDTYCKSKGIARQFTVPHTPEQNGIAERMNRTLVEKARAMLCHAGLPLKFWAEAVNAAAFLRNQSPASGIDGTPRQCYLGRQPKLRYLRVFGCDVYYHVPKVQRKKFDSKARKGIFVGYSPTTKGYRVFDLENRKIVLSRDVKFLESSFSGLGGRTDDDSETSSLELVYPTSADDDVHEVVVAPDHVADPRGDEPDVEEQGPEALDQDGPEDAIDQPANHIEDENQQQGGDQADQNASNEDEQQPERQPLRRSTRLKKPSEHRVKTHYYHANAAVTDVIVEPTKASEAWNGPQAAQWKAATDSEYQSILKNETWELVDLPKGKNVVGCKWVFKIKRRPDGSIDRYKVRLVAQGFSQCYGLDYDEVYAPVVRYNSVRTILAIANQLDLELHQMDVTTAFLNGKLTEEIYMKQPIGYEQVPNKVCKLKRSLYGLKQSARLWNFEIDRYLKEAGYRQSKADPCVYVKSGLPKGKTLIIALYVDDLLLATNDTKLLEAEKAALGQAFAMVDRGEAHFILGMTIERDRKAKTLKLGQAKYLPGVLDKFGMQDCKPVKTPMDKSAKFEPLDETCNEDLRREYQAAIGCLTYAVTATRPDLASAVNILSQFSANPSQDHWLAVKRVLRYVKATQNNGLVSRGTDETGVTLTGFSDADWAGDAATRKSTSGYIFKICGGAISWRSQRQPVVALSSTEAEYIALTVAAKELIWLRQLLGDLGFVQSEATTLYADNQGAIQLSHNPVYHDRTKHISVRFHFIREQVGSGLLELRHCGTSDMLADPLTKPVGGPQLADFNRTTGIG